MMALSFEKLVFLKDNMNLPKDCWKLEDSDEEDYYCISIVHFYFLTIMCCLNKLVINKYFKYYNYSIF